jgi:SAM-dependent methyltransferase
MSDLPADAIVSPFVARNREPIREALAPRLPATGVVLEIASGTGEHIAYNAEVFPALQWLPSEADPTARASIAAWRSYAGLPNLLPPLALDAADPVNWPVERAAAVVCINMVHISPWAATQGLMQGAGRLLPPGGPLFLYGAYLEAGVETAPSNLDFDLNLKARNPAWGLRRLDDVTALAGQHGLEFVERLAMPANNLFVVYRKTRNA